MYTFGRCACGISQWRVSGMPAIRVGSFAIDFSQAAKSIVPGNGVSMTNCAKVTPALLRDVDGRVERAGAVARQPEDERAEHVHAVMLERAQPLDELLAGDVEVLVDVLEAFRRHRLDADERALDARLAASRRGTPDPRPLPS